MTPLTQFINNAKDRGVAVFLERWFSQQIEPFGKLVNLTFCSQTKTLNLEALLKGESETIRITLQDYEFLEQTGSSFMIFNRGESSRLWITNAMAMFLLGRKIELPESYARMIRLGL